MGWGRNQIKLIIKPSKLPLFLLNLRIENCPLLVYRGSHITLLHIYNFNLRTFKKLYDPYIWFMLYNKMFKKDVFFLIQLVFWNPVFSPSSFFTKTSTTIFSSHLLTSSSDQLHFYCISLFPLTSFALSLFPLFHLFLLIQSASFSFCTNITMQIHALLLCPIPFILHSFPPSHSTLHFLLTSTLPPFPLASNTISLPP